MASWKLTTSDRDRLHAAILRHRFASVGDKLADQRAALAAKCFDKAFTKAERAQMEALPEGWLPKSSKIRVQFAGKVDSLEFSGASYGDRVLCASPREQVWRRIPKSADYGVALVVEATDRLGILHAQVCQAEAKAREDINNLSRQITAVMGQASTSGRLVALWPEVEPFLLSIGKAAPSNVPAVPIGALNKMLGLPVEAGATP